MPSLPTLPSVPAANSAGTSAWADNVANWINFVANPPTFLGTNTATQNITTGGSAQALALDTEEIDTAAGHSTVTNTSRYVAQYAGRYLCIAGGSFAANATGRRSVSNKVNGTTEYLDANCTVVGTSAGVTRVQSSRLIFLNVNDYVEAVLFQDSGSTLSCTGSLQVIWIASS